MENAHQSNASQCTPEEPCEIGYIGGGNALLFFQKKLDAQHFVKAWSRLLLQHAPGITPAVAIGSFAESDFNADRFGKRLKSLFKTLQHHKQTSPPDTILPRHGITAECRHSGLSTDVWNADGPEDERGYVSFVTNAKIRCANKVDIDIEKKYTRTTKEKFCFTSQIDLLGQISKEDSHIAIVHIDGNDMGMRFQKDHDLLSIRKLASSVDMATQHAFKALLIHIVRHYKPIMESLGFDNRHKPCPQKGKKHILPLRPIILGGDDVTFVCDGRLGLYCAKIFIEAFQKKTVSDGDPLTACAGVAIVKTKFPFSRGYELAEALCAHAKMVRKKEGKVDLSYIDFHLATGGFSGSLEDIRRQHYQAEQGYLLYRPYTLTTSDTDTSHYRNFDQLLDYAQAVEKALPRNKRQELRRVLSLSSAAIQEFMRDLTFRKKCLPDIDKRRYDIGLFAEPRSTYYRPKNSPPTVTPYFDLLELLEVYPQCKFDRQEGGAA